MRFRLQTAIVTALILCLPVAAIPQEEEPPPKWKGDIGLSATVNQGNTNNSNFSITANATGRLSEKIEWVNSGLFQFGRADDVTNAELYQLSTRLNWNHSERVFSYYEFPGVRDRFKNYAYRLSPGLGLGYKVINLESLILGFKGGIADIITKFYDTEETDSFFGVSVSDEFVWKFSETSEFNQKWDVTLSTADTNHYLSTFEANLIAQLIKSWSLKLTFINRYDSQPVGEGIKKSDSSFLAGLSWKF